MLGITLLLGCQKGSPLDIKNNSRNFSSIYNSGEKSSVFGGEAQMAFIIGDIRVALIKTGDTMVVTQDYGNYQYRYKLIYGGNWNDSRRYIHWWKSDGFYIPRPYPHIYFNHCGPLGQTHIFLDPPRNFCDQDTTWAHLRQHQRVWHHAYDPDGIYSIGLWDDFYSYSPNSPLEP